MFTPNLCQKVSDLTTTKMKPKNKYVIVSIPQTSCPASSPDTAWNKTATCVFVKFQSVCLLLTTQCCRNILVLFTLQQYNIKNGACFVHNEISFLYERKSQTENKNNQTIGHTVPTFPATDRRLCLFFK